MHQFTETDRIDKLAYKYYRDATLGWIIMSANPEFFHEFDVTPGVTIRIPYPLSRVTTELGLKDELD